MPCSGSARLNHHHLIRQEGWFQAEDSRLWDTWRHRTQGSAAAPTGRRGGSGPLPERAAEVRACGTHGDTGPGGSAAAPTGARGGSGPLPERGAEVPRLAPGWLDDSGLPEVRLPLVEAQVRPAEVRDMSAGVRARGPWLPLLSAFVLIL